MRDPGLSPHGSGTYCDNKVSALERIGCPAAMSTRRDSLPFFRYASLFTGFAGWRLVVQTLAAQAATSIGKS